MSKLGAISLNQVIMLSDIWPTAPNSPALPESGQRNFGAAAQDNQHKRSRKHKNEVSEVEAIRLIRSINLREDGVPLSYVTTRVRASHLPFYADYMLYSFVDSAASTPLVRYALVGVRGDLHPLDGSAGPIDTVNRLSPLSLTRETIVDYVHFYFAMVRNRTGRVRLLEDFSQLPLAAPLRPETRQKLWSVIKPMQFISGHGSQGCQVQTVLLLGEQLLQARLSIAADGTITLTQQQTLAENLPVVDIAEPWEDDPESIFDSLASNF